MRHVARIALVMMLSGCWDVRAWDAEAWALSHPEADAEAGGGAVDVAGDVSGDGGPQDSDVGAADARRDTRVPDDAEVVVCGDAEVCSPHQLCDRIMVGSHWCRCVPGRWDCDGNGYGWDDDGCESDRGCLR